MAQERSAFFADGHAATERSNTVGGRLECAPARRHPARLGNDALLQHLPHRHTHHPPLLIRRVILMPIRHRNGRLIQRQNDPLLRYSHHHTPAHRSIEPLQPHTTQNQAGTQPPSGRPWPPGCANDPIRMRSGAYMPMRFWGCWLGGGIRLSTTRTPPPRKSPSPSDEGVGRLKPFSTSAWCISAKFCI